MANDPDDGSNRAPLGAPPPEYRPTGVYESTDNSMRNIAIAAVAIAAVVMGGVYVLNGRHHHQGVPVIEADATPLRIKPTDRGGMTVAGADDAILSGKDGQQPDALAPPPEAPAPQILEQQAAKANARPILPPPAPPAPPPPAAPPSVPAPVALAPPPEAPLVREPAPEEPKPVPRPHAAPAGATLVQLAAVESEAGATAAWAQLTHRMPDLLAGHSPTILKAERNGKPFWRVRTGGFADIAAATQFCAKVRARGAGCAIASF